MFTVPGQNVDSRLRTSQAHPQQGMEAQPLRSPNP